MTKYVWVFEIQSLVKITTISSTIEDARRKVIEQLEAGEYDDNLTNAANVSDGHCLRELKEVSASEKVKP